MKFSKAIKKIVALGAGATLVGSTIMGAMALNLNEYPAPFIKDGKFSGVLVVGDKAAAEDVIGVSDIAMSLQYAAKTVKKTSTTAKTTVEGDTFLVEGSGDKLNLYEALFNSYQVLDATDLNALADGSITNEKGTYAYKQYITLSNKAMVKYYKDDDQSGDPAFYLHFAQGGTTSADDPNGNEGYAYKISFPTSMKSDIDSNSDLDDIDNKKITMLGKEYTIINTEYALKDSGGKLTLDLMGGAVSDTIQEGETKTYTINNKDYEVTLSLVTDTGTAYAKFVINGETTDKLVETNTFKLADGTEIGVKEILPNEAGDVTQDVVEFYLGAQKISLYDAIAINGSQSGTLSVAGDTVSDIAVDITGSNSSGDFSISTIEVWWAPSTDYYVPAGGKLSDRLAAEGDAEVLSWSNLNFELAGVNIEKKDEIKLSPNGDNSYKLKMKNKDGDTISEDIIFRNSNTEVILGKAADKKLVNIEGINGTSDEWFFVIEQGKFSHLMQVKTFDTTSNEIKLKDVGSGKTTTHTFPNGGGTVDFYKNGYKYTVTVNSGENNLTLTDITDGPPGSLGIDPNLAVLYTEHEGFVALVNTSHALWGNLDPGNNENISVVLFEDEDGQEDKAALKDWVNVSVYADSNSRLNVRSITLSDRNASQISWNSDTYKKTYYDRWGTYVYQDTSGNQNTVTLEYPGTEATTDVYVTAGVTTTSATEAGEAESVTIQKIEVGATKLASEVSDVAAQNVIAVGGPCANAASAKAKSNPEDCAAGYEAGKGLIELIDTGAGKVAMVVAGYSAADTRAATGIVANYGDNALSGTKMEVTTATKTVMEVTSQ